MDKFSSLPAKERQDFLAPALTLYAAGLRVIPYQENPDPAKQFPQWKKYRAGQTAEDVQKLFASPCSRLAILTGVDGIEVVDIDTKHDPTIKVVGDFFDLARQDEVANSALQKCVQVLTKSGGWHLIYRAQNIEPNQKLATRAGQKEAMIETRGVGGLLFVAPSPRYELTQGDYTNIQWLTDEERTALISICKVLNDRPDAATPHLEQHNQADTGETPWQVFNQRHTVLEMAEKAGWKVLRSAGGITYLNRPGAKNAAGVDATIVTTRKGEQRFYPFTTSSNYEANKCYSAFGMYVVEEHQGNTKTAAKTLRLQGYGPTLENSVKTANKTPKIPTNLLEEEGRYKWVSDNGKTAFISNFLVEPLYHLQHPDVPKRVFAVKNTEGKRKVLCAAVKDLAGCDAFKAIVEGQGNFVARWNSQQFSAIKECWFSAEKTAVEVNPLGYIPGTHLYAWANGIFDGQTFHPVNEFGIVELGEQRYFIPVFSSIYADNPTAFAHERHFVHNPASAVSFEQWAKLFNDAFCENQNGRIGVVFACAALFRDLIVAHTNFFPLLFLFGMRGTGKSTFRDALLSLFGQPQDAISLGSASSPKGFNRKLAQFRNATICFEEYKNGISSHLIEMLKNVYDGIGYERAQTTNDNRTHHTPVLSAVVLAGQELPTKENALLSRTLTTEFQSNTFSDEQRRAFDTLTDLQNSSGVTAATLDVLRHRALLEAQFVSTYREMGRWLKECKAPANGHTDGFFLPANVDERSINNAACLLAVYRILEPHLVFPFTLTELLDTLMAKLTVQVEIMSKTTEVNQFWDAFELLVSQNRLTEGRDFKVEKKGNETWIFIYPKMVWAAYAEQSRRTGSHALDESTLTSYLKRQPYFRPAKGRDGHQIRLGRAAVRCLAFEVSGTGISI